MYNMNYMHFGPGLDVGFPMTFATAFVVLLLWSVFWKGVALWYSAQREEKVWFIVLLIINTVGILEIIYIFYVAKIKFSELIHGHEHGVSK